MYKAILQVVIIFGAVFGAQAAKQVTPIFAKIQEEKKQIFLETMIECSGMIQHLVGCQNILELAQERMAELIHQSEALVDSETLKNIYTRMLDYIVKNQIKDQAKVFESLMPILKREFPTIEFETLQPLLQELLDNVVTIINISTVAEEWQTAFVEAGKKLEKTKKELIGTGMSHEEVEMLEREIWDHIVHAVKEEMAKEQDDEITNQEALTE